MEKVGIGTYLIDIVRNYTKDPLVWPKVLWDVSAIAWLVNFSWIPTHLVHSSLITD